MSAGRAVSAVPRVVRDASRVLAACAAAAAALTVATLCAWWHYAAAADLYRELAPESPRQIEQTLEQVRGPLVFGGVIAVGTVLLWAWLAVAVRVPQRRWPQITTWVVSALGMGLLLVGLNGGVVGTGSAAIGITPLAVLGYDLVPAWYPAVNGVLGIITLVLMAAGAFALTRQGVADYYRTASWQSDDRWAGFVADQKDRMADGS